MSERYKKLFHLEHRLYAPEAPVIIMAGSLLRDAYSEGLLCQLKFRNIQPRPIKSLRAVVQMLDVNGDPIGKPVDHRYLDLNLQQEEEFGRDTAIVLPSREARAFTVRVNQISFADGEIWQDEGEDWTALPDQPTLAEYYGDPEMETQFQVRYGSDCHYAPVLGETLWFCTCGAVNQSTDGKCHRCHRKRSALLQVDTEALRAESKTRQEAEKLLQDEERQEANGRRKKWLLRAAIALPLVILALGAALTVPKMLARSRAYDQAQAMLESGDFDSAAAAFAALGSYRDSADYPETVIPYRFARHLMDCAQANDASALTEIGLTRSDGETDAATLLYQAAAERFEALGDYEDSRELAQQCRDTLAQEALDLLGDAYEEAAALLEGNSYSLAREAFLELGDYEDSAERAKEAVYRKALALYEFVENHDVSGISAALTMEPGESSVFSLSKEKALALGSGALEELRTACGEDFLSIQVEDSPAGDLKPLGHALAALFRSLGDYEDSADYAAALPALTDYTRAFTQMCQEGDLAGALAWLNDYEGDFENREHWVELLTLYQPFCRSWALYSGDPTLIPLIQDAPGECYSFRSLVILREDQAVLRLLLREDDAEGPELTAEPGETRFILHTDTMNYLAEISPSGNLGVIKLVNAGTLGGAEYKPVQ